MARVDPSVPYGETIGYISEYVKLGVIDGISLSEVGKESIQAALKVFPISCVELELSLFSQEVITTGILEELSKHNLPLIAYSPLCRGLLTDYAVENSHTFWHQSHKVILDIIWTNFNQTLLTKTCPL